MKQGNIPQCRSLGRGLSRLICLLFIFSPGVSAQTYFLAVQPILSKQRTLEFYQPLATYLSHETGLDIRIYASHNFVTYWESLRKDKDYDLALDAAHFTGYRVKRMGYQVLVKIKDTVSYSLISNDSDMYFEANELIGKRIATLSSPSIGGVRLMQMYPNPLRQPQMIGTNNFQEALRKLKNNEVSSALVPTPLISGDSTVNTILTTDPVPHMALSASSRMDKITQAKIQQAMLKANNSEAGRLLFEQLNLSGFEKSSNATYSHFDVLLHDVWGYGN